MTMHSIASPGRDSVDFPCSSLMSLGKFDSLTLKTDLASNPTAFANDFIWTIKTNPRIKFFLWLSSLDRLLHNKTLFTKSISPSPFCPFCHSILEDSIHIFRDCPMASKFWDTFTCLPSDFYSLPSTTWLHNNLSDKNPCKDAPLVPWNTTFSYCLWDLWKRRNAWIFSKKSIPMETLKKTILFSSTEYFYSQKAPSLGLSLNPISSWSPPPPSHLKVNCDASYSPHTKTMGIGAICRNNLGRWSGSFQASGPCSSPLLAELEAIIAALKWINSNLWSNVNLESDCKAIIDLILDLDRCSNIYASRLTFCRDCLSEGRISLSWCPRQSNSVADHLAREAREAANGVQRNFLVHQTQPPAVRELIVMDCNILDYSGQQGPCF